jgi:hypothetical protein
MAIGAEGLLIAAVLLVRCAGRQRAAGRVAHGVADHVRGGLAGGHAAVHRLRREDGHDAAAPLAAAGASAGAGPASAVLSGVIVKAGLVGWLRLLPLGEAGFTWAACRWWCWVWSVALAAARSG